MTKKQFKSTDFFDECGILLMLQRNARYWKITKNGELTRVENPEDINGPILSFYDEDYRIYFDKLPSSKKQKNAFLSEFGARVRTIHPKGKNYVYGTPAMRIDEMGHPLVPGVSYLDKILEQNNIPLTEERIVGFEFKEKGDVPDPQNILILFALDGQGGISPSEATLNVDDKRLVLREFSKTFNIKSDKPASIFSSESLFELEYGFHYPLEDDIGGISISVAKKIIVALLGAGVLGEGAYLGYLKQQEISLNSQTKELAKKVEQVKVEKEAFLVANSSAIAKAFSLDVVGFMDIAEQIGSSDSEYLKLLEFSVGEDRTAVYKLKLDAFYMGYKTDLDVKIAYDKLVTYLNANIKYKEQPIDKQQITPSKEGNYEIEYKIQTSGIDINSIIGGR